VYTNFQCRNVQEMERSIVKHCTPRSQIMWNVILNSSYTSSYIINVDQNKKRKQSPRMRRRDCNLPFKFHLRSLKSFASARVAIFKFLMTQILHVIYINVVCLCTPQTMFTAHTQIRLYIIFKGKWQYIFFIFRIKLTLKFTKNE
jgi:hypothetical protein